MAKIKTVIIWLIALVLSMNHVHAATFDGHHLATGIDVVILQNGANTSYHFQKTNNIESILNYIRLLEYAGAPTNDPELQTGDTYRLIVHLADGNQHIYHLHTDRFLSRDFRPWVKVESPYPFFWLLQTLSEEK